MKTPPSGCLGTPDMTRCYFYYNSHKSVSKCHRCNGLESDMLFARTITEWVVEPVAGQSEEEARVQAVDYLT